MENPWANGWSDEAQNPTLNDQNPTISAMPSWAAHSGQETDLSAPSWSTSAEIKWTEPSQTHGTLWSHAEDPGHLDAWGSSTYKGTTLGRLTPDLPSPQEEESPPLSLVRREETPPIPSLVQETTITPPRVPSPVPQSSHIPPSPDVFGRFETAVNAENTGDDDPWSSSASAFPPENEEVDQWGSNWKIPKVEEEEHAAKVLPDEWEVARQHKESMDRQIPPELLASILSKCEETARDLWPDPESANDLSGDDYRSNLYCGMDGVEGLTSLINRIAPEEMSIPPTIPFGKTFTAKSMAESVRLSRHTPLTRLSPMSQLMASKGSTAWETSVKSRPEVIQDDLPVGWRVVEGDREAPTQAADAIKGKNIGGGLLSFWGRRTVANVSADTKRETSVSPVHASSASPRSSIDSAKPPPARKPDSLTTTSTSTALSVVSPTLTTTSSTSSSSSKPAQPDLFDPVEAQPAASAVSRFLGRFSRTKNTTSNQRHSLALSSDDLSFLSDFVPSASDDHDAGDLELNALSNMIQSSPSPKKLPPPLAPPPKPISRPVSLTSVLKPPIDANNDLEAFFSLSTGPSAMSTTSSLHPPIPPSRSPASSVISASSVTSPPSTSFYLPSDSSPVDNPLSSFVLPPPPSPSRSQSPATITPPLTSRSSYTKSASPPPLLPPPLRTRTSKTSPPTISLLSNSFEDGDDEFSDSHSPASKAYGHFVTSQYDPRLSPQSSKRPFFSDDLVSQEPTNSSEPVSSTFDDFDDFVSSPLRSPSPPIPPAKPPPQQHIITPPPKVTSIHQIKLSGANHLRPANSFEIDLFGDVSSTKLSQDNTKVASSMQSLEWMNSTRPTPSNGPTRLSPPPAQTNVGSSSFSQSLMSFSSNSAQLSAPSFGAFNSTSSSALAPPASKPSSVGTQGGLSAQDLSFFEGL